MSDEKIFKPSDFHLKLYQDELNHGHRVVLACAELVANVANEKIAKLLGPKVYGHVVIKGEGMRGWLTELQPFTDQVAYLFNAQEVKKVDCEHIAYIKYAIGCEGVYPNFSICEKCGKKLKATWTVE
jgi:hypothetical protein